MMVNFGMVAFFLQWLWQARMQPYYLFCKGQKSRVTVWNPKQISFFISELNDRNPDFDMTLKCPCDDIFYKTDDTQNHTVAWVSIQMTQSMIRGSQRVKHRQSHSQTHTNTQPLSAATSSCHHAKPHPAAWVTALHQWRGLLSTHQRHCGARRTKIYHRPGLFDLRPGVFTYSPD